MRMFVLVAAAGFLISCGVVGSPVAPESVGVAITIDKQKRQHTLEAEREASESSAIDPSLENHDINLPPSQPIGTR
jgi:hypothetical protein